MFALIFLVIALCVTRKKSKRSIFRQTGVLCLVICCLTAGFGVIMDVALPDVIADATSSTLYVEDVYNNYEKQAEYNAGMVREFARLNIANGNWDKKYAYADLEKKDADGNYINADIQKSYANYVALEPDKLATKIAGLGKADKELYDFLYNKYILMDYDYALIDHSKLNQRQSFALALVDKMSAPYATLCKEGMSNDRLAYLFNNN
ncbi:MAG: hypothetical protein RR338_06470, partial [Clostridia bacterium]